MNRRAFLLASTAVGMVAVLPPTTDSRYPFTAFDFASGRDSMVFWGLDVDGKPVFDVCRDGEPTRQSFLTLKGMVRNVSADPKKAALSVPTAYRHYQVGTGDQSPAYDRALERSFWQTVEFSKVNDPWA